MLLFIDMVEILLSSCEEFLFIIKLIIELIKIIVINDIASPGVKFCCEMK